MNWTCFRPRTSETTKRPAKVLEILLWPDGPVCPHCGVIERISKMQGKSTRIGTYKCYQCRKPFTVKVGTVFESSHVPLRHWLQAMFLLASSKKGISANQLARTLGCTLKTGWFIGHRIREAMKDQALMLRRWVLGVALWKLTKLSLVANKIAASKKATAIKWLSCR